jgi:nucleoside-diphosphate-sugar epimerase
MSDMEKIKGMKALVTGGTGFTGSHLVRRLRQGGAFVRILARDPARCRDFQAIGVEIAGGDIRDPAVVDRATEGMEAVFHLAAAYRTAGLPDSDYRDIHVTGTQNVLASCLRHGVARVVHCSTVGVHGHVETPPATEESPFHPGDIYQATKLEGERKAVAFGRESGLPVTIIRPCAIYGPGDMRLLKLFRIASRRVKWLLGDGRVFYHMVYVDDLSEAFLLAAIRENVAGETFIIGGPEVLSLNQLVDLIADELGATGRTVHLPVAPFRILAGLCERLCAPFNIPPPIYRRRVDFFTKSRSFDIRRATTLLGYAPSVGIREGVRRTADWYRKRGLL